MKKTGIVLAVVAVAIFAFVAYSGIFYSVTVEEREVGPYTMILKAHRGSYYGTAKVFEEVTGALKAHLDTDKLVGVGIYYDDPAQVKAEELRSECGFIIEARDLPKIAPLRGSFIIKNFPKTNCVACDFPVRTPLAYMLGPSRAYPKLGEYIEEKKYTAEYGMEIYYNSEKKITYCMPVMKK
ncbi:MAG: GyrI-like domain-containing protein [Spirochaetes bacterium]|nr:GyrI-like domain-containing protein [Spirochaetota bacterium]